MTINGSDESTGSGFGSATLVALVLILGGALALLARHDSRTDRADDEAAKSTQVGRADSTPEDSLSELDRSGVTQRTELPDPRGRGALGATTQSESRGTLRGWVAPKGLLPKDEALEVIVRLERLAPDPWDWEETPPEDRSIIARGPVGTDLSFEVQGLPEDEGLLVTVAGKYTLGVRSARLDDREARVGLRVPVEVFASVTVQFVAPEGAPEDWAAPHAGRPFGVLESAGCIVSFPSVASELSADGSITFRGVGASHWILSELETDDILPRFGGLLCPGRVTFSAKPSENLLIEVPLVHASTARGMVTAPDGNPIAGATVEVLDHVEEEEFHMSWELRATTGVDGRFRIEGAPPDADLMTVEAEGYASATIGGVALRRALDGDSAMAITLAPHLALEVQPRAPEGTDPMTVTVRVEMEGGETVAQTRVQTGDVARFELPRGRVRIAATATEMKLVPSRALVPWYAPIEELDLSANAHRDASPVTLDLRPCPPVRGQLVPAGAGVGGDGHAYARLEPISGALLGDPQNPPPGVRLRVDGATGSITGALPPGEYVVHVSHSSGWNGSLARRCPPVQFEVTEAGAHFEVKPAATIPLLGRAVDASGSPVPGARIRVQGMALGQFHQGVRSEITTDAFGRFEVPCIESGRYEVVLLHDQWLFEPREVSVPCAEQTFEAREGGYVAVAIDGATSGEIGLHMLHGISEDGVHRRSIKPGGRPGTYYVGPFPDGAVSLTARWRDPATDELQMRALETDAVEGTTVNVRLAPTLCSPVAITGRVLGKGRAGSGQTVSARMGGQFVGRARTRHDGSFTLQLPCPGTVTVGVTSSDHVERFEPYCPTQTLEVLEGTKDVGLIKIPTGAIYSLRPRRRDSDEQIVMTVRRVVDGGALDDPIEASALPPSFDALGVPHLIDGTYRVEYRERGSDSPRPLATRTVEVTGGRPWWVDAPVR